MILSIRKINITQKSILIHFYDQYINRYNRMRLEKNDYEEIHLTEQKHN